MSGGGFNFISSPRLLVFRLLVLRRSFNRICSLFGWTTVQTVGEDEELRCAVELVCTTLVTVMVCLDVVPADGLVTTIVPSDGNWFSWFKTKVVVEGCGFSCKYDRVYNQCIAELYSQILKCQTSSSFRQTAYSLLAHCLFYISQNKRHEITSSNLTGLMHLPEINANHVFRRCCCC